MSIRYATLSACMLISIGTAPLATAEPDAAPAPPPPGVPVEAPPNGPVPSAAPGVLNTPDGWAMTVSGTEESMEAVAPLTTALSSREYLVDGTFTGAIKGTGSTKLGGGTLEAGYQIGCGIVGGPVELTGGIGLTPTLAIPGLGGSNTVGGTLVSGQIKIGLKPGTVSTVPVDKKSFKGATVG